MHHQHSRLSTRRKRSQITLGTMVGRQRIQSCTFVGTWPNRDRLREYWLSAGSLSGRAGRRCLLHSSYNRTWPRTKAVAIPSALFSELARSSSKTTASCWWNVAASL